MFALEVGEQIELGEMTQPVFELLAFGRAAARVRRQQIVGVRETGLGHPVGRRLDCTVRFAEGFHGLLQNAWMAR